MKEPITSVFSAAINEEGASRTKRGKIPSGLIEAIGGQQGDRIKFEVQGRRIIGGAVVKSGTREFNELAEASHVQSRATSTAGETKAAVAPKVPAKAAAKVPAKVPATKTPAGRIPKAISRGGNGAKVPAPTKTAGKSPARKTVVSYDRPKVSAKVAAKVPAKVGSVKRPTRPTR